MGGRLLRRSTRSIPRPVEHESGDQRHAARHVRRRWRRRPDRPEMLGHFGTGGSEVRRGGHHRRRDECFGLVVGRDGRVSAAAGGADDDRLPPAGALDRNRERSPGSTCYNPTETIKPTPGTRPMISPSISLRSPSERHVDSTIELVRRGRCAHPSSRSARDWPPKSPSRRPLRWPVPRPTGRRGEGVFSAGKT